MAILYERWDSPGNNLVAIYDDRYEAQTFTVGNTGENVQHHITSVKLRMKYVDVQWNFIVSIRAVNGSGEPTGPDLTSVIVDGSVLTTVISWIEIALPEYVLEASTKYAIVVGAPDAPGGGGGIIELSRSTAQGYGGGNICYSTDFGVTWGSNLTRDYTFYEYGLVIGRQLKTIETKNETALNGVSVNE